MKWPALFIWCFITSLPAASQTIGEFLPENPNKSEKFLFYFHGGVVTELGNNAINQSVPEWGPYEYLNILDSLQKQGFNVISEMRKKGVDNAVYIDKVSLQVDSLLKSGVPEKNILILGASAGWDITLHVSSRLRNKSLNYVIMGGCWPETYKEYAPLELYGHFLSVIEKTDPHGTCVKIFEKRKLKSFQEIALNTGLSHGFIYKGYHAWVDPIVSWFEDKR